MTTAAPETTAAEVLPWDTAHFGVRVARVTDPTLAWLDLWVLNHRPDVLYLRLPADDVAGAHRAERRGFRLMDVRVTLEHERAWIYPDPPLIRDARTEDLDALVAIARTAFTHTRFTADVRFGRERVEAMYEEWLRKEWGEAFVLVSGRDDPTGFVTVTFKDGEATIGLIAVREDVRHSGLGGDLTRAAQVWALTNRDARVLRVVTSARNVPALRMYEAAGFRTVKTELDFHRWLP